MREFARQVAAKGIKRINGRILVDASLFPEGVRELGTGVVISPIVVNDNVVDVVVSPGPTEGSPVQLKIAPQTAYITITNQAKTGKAGSKTSLDYENEKLNPDGTRSATLTGSLAIGSKPTMASYPVPEPSRFAATVLMEALKEQGVTSTLPAATEQIDFKALAPNYIPENIVAEHASPPLKEDVKVTLKVSQNLHASSMPFLLGALLAHKDKQIDQAGFDLENEFLTKAGLDLGGAAQINGAGGNAYFSPDFMTRYLFYMSKRKDYQDFYRSLPILGKDGTLVKIQVNSPAAGHVHAKTGTYGLYDALNKKLMITGKGLAGYMDTAAASTILACTSTWFPTSMDDPDAAQTILRTSPRYFAADALLRNRGPSTSNDADVLIKKWLHRIGRFKSVGVGDIAIAIASLQSVSSTGFTRSA
jgi:D-alanyl-D-alanine carboxypeptidase/D-alanyl-D-alanine-endopeptidase (penicillin-binding protein 4)